MDNFDGNRSNECTSETKLDPISKIMSTLTKTEFLVFNLFQHCGLSSILKLIFQQLDIKQISVHRITSSIRCLLFYQITVLGNAFGIKDELIRM